MPTYQVTDPSSGKTLKLTGDSPPTEQELEEIFSSVQSQDKEMPPGGFAGGVANEALQGATFGFSDEVQSMIAAAIASPFVSDKTFSQLMVDARNSLRDEQGNFREQNPKTALAANIAGGVATGSGLFKGAKTVGDLAKAGAVTGAIAGAGFSDSDEFVSTDTAIDATVGAATGAALGGALGKVSAAIQKRLNRPDLQIYDDAGKFTDEAIEELGKKVQSGQIAKEEAEALIKQSSKNGGVLTQEQAKRYNLFVERGVTPTRANITQSTSDFVEQQSAIKRTGPVAETVARQDEQLTNLAREGIENIGPTAQNIQEANASVYSVVDDVVTRLDDEVSKAYKAARQKAGDSDIVSVNNLLSTLHKNRGENQISKGLITSVRTQLKDRGLLSEGFDKKISVNEAEKIRQFINSKFDSTSAQGRKVIRELKDALDEDVAKVADTDAFSNARQAKINFQKTIEKSARNKFDKSRSSFLEDVIDNKIPEERIIPRLIGGRDDDFLKMKDFLLNDAGEQGVKAFNDIKAQVLRDALDKATGTMGKTEGGQKVFNVRLFKNALQRLQKSKKYEALFNKDERKLIDDIIEIGNLRIPVSGTQTGKGPTELAVSEARRKILEKIPLVGDSAQGLLDAVSNLRTDRRLLDVTRETESALTR